MVKNLDTDCRVWVIEPNRHELTALIKDHGKVARLTAGLERGD